MKISIFGLGYVGCISGACLAETGNMVIGVDTNKVKVDLINSGKSPVVEKDIDVLMGRTVANGAYSATTDTEYAIANSEMAFVCVGTPSKTNGRIELDYIKRVAEQIGQAIAKKNEYYVVVVRSTVFPGTVEQTVLPLLEQRSGKKAGKEFGLCMNPEFLREGTSIHDFYHPPKTVIGEFDRRSGDTLAKVYEKIDAPLIRTTLRTAEMVKYVDNPFHALKVAFANEVGTICKELSIDSHEVMDIFCMDRKLNISPAYFKPGFAFGGSCLPKDLRALTYEAKLRDVELPLMSSILESNNGQIVKAVRKLMEYKGKTIGFLGLSFKGGTDDLRESPLVEVIELLLGKGIHIRIYDKNVSLARLMGANKEYIEREIPHISSLMCSSIDDLLKESDVLVIGNKEEEFKTALGKARADQIIFDLVRIIDDTMSLKPNYYGICW